MDPGKEEWVARVSISSNTIVLMGIIYLSKVVFLLDIQGYTFVVFPTLKVPLASSTLLTHIGTLPNEQNLTCWRKSEASNPPGIKKWTQFARRHVGLYPDCPGFALELCILTFYVCRDKSVRQHRLVKYLKVLGMENNVIKAVSYSPHS